MNTNQNQKNYKLRNNYGEYRRKSKSNASVFEAEGNGVHATGPASHAEGSATWANGNNSHAEGIGTIVNGWCSHTEGDGLAFDNGQIKCTRTTAAWGNEATVADLPDPRVHAE